MAERTYEGMFLLDANRYSRDATGVTGRVGEMIEKCGGEILVARLWAEQKLAYPINGNRKGAYWLVYFKMDGNKLTELRRAAQLNGDVMRELVLTVDDRLVETLVSHAQGSGTKVTPAPATPATPAAEEPAAADTAVATEEG